MKDLNSILLEGRLVVKIDCEYLVSAWNEKTTTILLELSEKHRAYVRASGGRKARVVGRLCQTIDVQDVSVLALTVDHLEVKSPTSLF